jgi:hypothetical protein
MRAVGQLIDQAGDRFLVRHGDIQATHAVRGEIAQSRFQLRRRDVEGFVAEVLAGLSGEQAVDHR